MKKSVKAALFSAFIFPGAGHFFLKKYIPGVVLVVAILVPLYFIVSSAVKRALEIVDKILLGEVQADIATITDLVSSQPAGADAPFIKLAWIVIIISWLIGIADSYRVGRSQDKADLSDQN